jgi:leucyl aminopeptidase
MFVNTRSNHAISLFPLIANDWESIQATLTASQRQWAILNGFTAKAGQICVLPDAEGGLAKVLVAYDDNEGKLWALAALPEKLPVGEYYLDCLWDRDECTQAAIGWGLGHYQFRQFRQPDKQTKPVLFVEADLSRAERFIQAVTLVRDLINLPANHMMPEHLSAVMQQLAVANAGVFSEIVGDDLLVENYPAVHAVGRASAHAPRMLELTWGKETDPALTLVGKGVCFDTGGLDIKPSQYMRLMQKDMGGAAHVLGLAQLIMQMQLPVRLRVLIPAVDNAIGGDAFRPGDILATRAGKQVEVDNTDAEGRLILCDALTAAAEQNPGLILDFATLTGAARVALGTEIPVFFSNNKGLTAQLQVAAETTGELIWNLPLHKPYFAQLKSHFADFLNSGGSYGGAITAALFLNEFVPESTPWAHFDVMAWNTRARAGRPIGGEAMGLFAVYRYLETVYH